MAHPFFRSMRPAVADWPQATPRQHGAANNANVSANRLNSPFRDSAILDKRLLLVVPQAGGGTPKCDIQGYNTSNRRPFCAKIPSRTRRGAMSTRVGVLLVARSRQDSFSRRFCMKVGFYGHVRQYHNFKSEIDANIQAVLESGNYVMGPMLKRFEQELAVYHGTKYAVGVGNGTDALWLSFLALGIGPGDECITTTNTFFATAEAIWVAGATAVFVDSDPKTNCIDPSKIEAAITPKTKAIVPVHLYGQCADMKAIRKIADQHGLLVVEDNAQAIGSRGDGFKTAELSDAMCTSFIIQKNLGCFGDGGAVITNNATVDRLVRKLRNHGSDKRSCHSMGYNSRLDDIQAGVLSAKLKHIDDGNALRQAVGRAVCGGPAGRRQLHAA